MRKYLLLILISFILLPLNVFAQTYSLKDLSISIDDSTWYVFTRDNIEENSELDELGISYDYLNNFMNTNDIYLDACQFDKNDETNTMELFVVAKKINNVNNLHTYSNSEINELGETLKDKVGANSFNIYSVDKYKYVHVKYYDSSTSYNIDEYYTVINGYGYTILAQKTNPFSNFEECEIKNIVDSTNFKYNSNYERKSSSNNTSSSNNISIWVETLIESLTTGIIGILIALFHKNKKKRP